MENEIHVKIGGDHGGPTFKQCYEVVNCESPNSKDNTCIFSTFDGKDYRVNLVTALSRFTNQIDELQTSSWE